MSEQKIEANGIEFAYREAGSGPLLLCLHGFPDSPASFEHQLSGFAEAGYRVVTPYLRGYPPTATEGPYQAAVFGQDVVALVDALGESGAIVFGHDWGTSGAYMSALLAPEKIRAVIGSAVPYGTGIAGALMSNYAQQKRSWYVFFFQTALADIAVPMNDYAFINRLWADWSPGFDAPKAVIAEAKKCLAADGGLEAALGYYRAAFDASQKSPDLWDIEGRFGAEPIGAPTLYIHGEKDGCIGVEVTEGMESSVTGQFEKKVVEGAGHFVHLEKPDEVNALVIDWLTKHDLAPR